MAFTVLSPTAYAFFANFSDNIGGGGGGPSPSTGRGVVLGDGVSHEASMADPQTATVGSGGVRGWEKR